MDNLEHLALIGGERADAADHCMAGIARLSKEVQDASSYVPAHDQRTYSEAIKALNEKLTEARAIYVPKPKFSFKTARKNPSAISLSDAAEMASAQRRMLPGYSQPPSTESSMAPTPLHISTPPNEASNSTQASEKNNQSLRPNAPIHKPSFSSSKSVSIFSHTSLHIILPSSASHATSSASLTNLKQCIVDMSTNSSSPSGQAFAGLTMKNIKNSLLICGSVNGAAHVTNVENSAVVVRTRQFRMHDCRDCVVYIECQSRPIVEGCHGIKFSPLPAAFGNHSNSENTPPTTNFWNQVDDFKHLKSTPSPNWSILPPAEIIPDETWREVVPGGPGWSLADILKAVGVGAS
ncbi:MAG: hypothetical protein MMC33_006937 [Icmadophila ericetorum]|nr:hypothetical protein [Icmadophila ericetorum]